MADAPSFGVNMTLHPHLEANSHLWEDLGEGTARARDCR